jgi:hypothetical protein
MYTTTEHGAHAVDAATDATEQIEPFSSPLSLPKYFQQFDSMEDCEPKLFFYFENCNRPTSMRKATQR